MGLLTIGCGTLPRPAGTPVAATWHRLSEAPPAASTLLVLLPGRRERPGDFERHGFFADIRPQDRLDVVTVDLHLGYYQERTLDVRLRQDILEPARQRGYRRIELVGLSLGGLGALIYADRAPGDIDRIVLLSPYTGGDAIIEEIRAAGGLAQWKPGPIEKGDRDREIWAGWRTRPPATSDRPVTSLGVGSRDRFREANTFFATTFLKGRLKVVDGGHDWEAWKALFRHFYHLEPNPGAATPPKRPALWAE